MRPAIDDDPSQEGMLYQPSNLKPHRMRWRDLANFWASNGLHGDREDPSRSTFYIVGFFAFATLGAVVAAALIGRH